MKIRNGWAIGAVAASLMLFGSAGPAAAREGGPEVWLMGGVQALNQNDTAFPDDFINVPAVVGVGYPVSSVFALEGEFTWMIPIEQSVDMGGGQTADRKTPDILAYQANVRADLPVGGSFRPYLVGGAGAMTFLSNTDPNRTPALSESETAFAVNFGTGFSYRLTPSWSLRGDLRELVAFPKSDAAGLSAAGDADEVWTERGTLGVGYHF